MKKIILSTLVFFLVGFLANAQDMDVSKWIQPVDPSARFRLDSFMVWCGSAVKGDDNKYYLFYSRWPRKLGHLAWATHSEVAVAVADQPTGPYNHVKVILPKRDKQFWDADVTHNPTIHKFGNTYYLYYMGNHGNGEWWDHRNHQRIGLATSKSPLGPWKRVSQPLVDTTTNGFDHVIASNPSVMKRLDGKYQMIYKGVSKGPMPFGGVVTHGAALANKPEGPFIKTPYKIFIKDTVKFAAEDPYIWAQDGKYWAIVKDMKGVFTNAGTSLALFESADGFDWKLAKHALVSTTNIPWKSGSKKVEKLERPQLLIEDGKPTVLFCAVYDGNDNYNIAIPLEPAGVPSVSNTLPGKDFQLLYEDNFIGDNLNERDWQYRTGRRTGMGYMDGLNLKENVYVKDSALHIAVKHELIDGKWENTGGGLISKHNFGYGYYESLSKPFMEGHGVHTSFWQRGGANPNNNIFEIDSYEIDSKTWVATNNLYVDLPYNGYSYTPWPHRAQVPFRFQKDGWFHDAYEFSPEGVIFYDNGQIVAKAEYKDLNAHQVVWLTALNGVGKVDSTQLPGESIFKYFRYYGKDYPGHTILPNGNFEFNQQKTDPFKPLCWEVQGTPGAAKLTFGDASRGDYKLLIGNGTKHETKVIQSLEFIMNGEYELSAMIRSSKGHKGTSIVIDGLGDKNQVIALNPTARWKKITIPKVLVNQHKITIAIVSNGNENDWLEIDDIQFMKPLAKGNSIKKEESLPPVLPMWHLAKKEPIQFAGDQKFYFFDRNVGYGDSISVLFDLTAASLANMTPIARIPKKGLAGWSVQTTVSGGMIFRIGSIEEHQDVFAENIYEPGKQVSIALVFENGNASIYKNGLLVKKEYVAKFNTKDATAAGRVGTVGKEFEAVGDVVMQVGKEERESLDMKIFRGSLQNLRIYNNIVKQ
jgi:hypothetical protein